MGDWKGRDFEGGQLVRFKSARFDRLHKLNGISIIP